MERERVGMMIMSSGLLMALVLGYLLRPAERPAITMTEQAAPKSQTLRKIKVAEGSLSADAITLCRRTLSEATREGVIRARPSATRINVDEDRWDRITPTQQNSILQATSCTAWLGAAPPKNERIVAYGWSSGRRIATLSGVRGRP